MQSLNLTLIKISQDSKLLTMIFSSFTKHQDVFVNKNEEDIVLRAEQKSVVFVCGILRMVP